ncbi:hypothetical protein [Chryseobacterium rhizosphaerae]|jgi:hypothetical protein|uniref:hypothetical protein n=1 Tax=Chryseobacterium rhizosphaerae TaxID=395937 RepID=UPI0023584ADF|nr:hypothetical protein [Chryseobacterium rhizosphaerae]MDC8101794.1 hypothetical protein [Chryseobacterium rhizosphaerae]
MKKLLSTKSAMISGSLFICLFVNAQVGIGLNSPQETLHVKGTLRLENPSEGIGKVLQVFNNGSMKWSVSTASPLLGTIETNNGINTFFTTPRYLNGRIDLPPGKWIVKMSQLISAAFTGDSTAGAVAETYFTDSNMSSSPTSDYLPNSATIMSGSCKGSNLYGMLVGNILLNNQTNNLKSYYLWGTLTPVGTGGSHSVYGFSASYWGENRIYAVPFE